MSRRRQLLSDFSRDAGLLSTTLIAVGESLAGHPHRRLFENTISFWRAGTARDSDRVCFSCGAAFGVGRAVPGAFLLAVGTANRSSAAIGSLCVGCFAKTDAEIDQAAARMLRRITGPSGRWFDPSPNPQGVRQ